MLLWMKSRITDNTANKSLEQKISKNGFLAKLQRHTEVSILFEFKNCRHQPFGDYYYLGMTSSVAHLQFNGEFIL